MSLLLWLVLSASAKPRVYTAVRVGPVPPTGLCAGETAQLEVFGTQADGKESKVKLGAWKDFVLTWDVAPVGSKGAVEMPRDPRETWKHPGVLVVQHVTDKTIRAETTIPVRYDCALRIDRSGAMGSMGPRGDKGSATADADGGDGQDGHDLEVRVALVKEPTRDLEVLQVEVTDLADGTQTFAAIAAHSGRLDVAASGGSGGPGGQGGDGGSGATNRNGGKGGDGGNGGNGGKGGRITLTLDAKAAALAALIRIDNGPGAAGGAGLGGAGGQAFEPGVPGQEGHDGHPGQPGAPGPIPTTKTAPVGSLW